MERAFIWCSFKTHVFLAFLICLVLWIVLRRKPSILPPGPRGLPIVGYLPFMGRKAPHLKFAELSRKYGDIVCVNLMGRTVVSLNSYDAIYECFANNAESFSGRPSGNSCFLWWLTDGMSISQEEGSMWKEHRDFALRTLRDCGFGNVSMETRIQEIGMHLISGLRSTLGVPFDPFYQLSNTTLNAILFLTCSKYYDVKDPVYRKLRENLDFIRRHVTGFSAMYNSSFFPVHWHSTHPYLCESKRMAQGYSLEQVKVHEQTYDENNLRDYIDVFLNEKKAAEKKGRTGSTFTNERLQRILLNFLIAGTETTSNTLYWAIRILCDRQDVQKKLHVELDEVVGRNRVASTQDTSNLPYLEAFTMELLRYSTVSPLGMPHCNPDASSLWGYQIPPNSVIFANLWAVNNDKEYWDEPDKFVPERFLNPKLGKERRERLLTFSVGNRACLGEDLARTELFIFLTMLLQNFVFKLANKEEDFRKQNTFNHELLPFQVLIQERC